MFKTILLAIAVICYIVLLIVNYHDRKWFMTIIVAGLITFAIVGQQDASDQSLLLLYAIAIIATLSTMYRQHKEKTWQNEMK